MDSTPIDDLLEHYLKLLDEYTQLRSSLSTAQSGMYSNIARANFSAERGLRYGPDYYDDRMQALRRVEISWSDDGCPSFSVVKNENPVCPKPEEELQEIEVSSEKSSREKDLSHKPKDPLKWFGILTPHSLRVAQGQAIQVVEQIVPRLASLNAQMVEVEIQVRRARKKRAKAVAAEKKQSTEGVSREEVAV